MRIACKVVILYASKNELFAFKTEILADFGQKFKNFFFRLFHISSYLKKKKFVSGTIK